jgi:predicted TIM-barrel fold metal-dependent hydrolase
MTSPWGDLPITDAHIHFFSHRFFAALSIEKPGTRPEDIPAMLGWECPLPDPEALADRWVLELDHHGVQKAALIASVPNDEDSVAAAVSRHPDRFYGYFMCNPGAPDALARVQAAFEKGLHAVCFFPAMHRFSMTDDRVRPLLEAAADRPGRIAFVHCGVLSVGVRKKLDLPSHFDMRYSNPIDLHTLALQFPQLPFVIPHFGAGYLREALMLSDLCPNVYLDTSSTNRWIKYMTEPLDLAAVFARTLEIAGPKRLLFGTDSSFLPRGWQAQIFEEQVQILARLGIGTEDAGLIFGGNLERILAR